MIYNYRQIAIGGRYGRMSSLYELSKIHKIVMPHELHIQLPNGDLHQLRVLVSFPKAPGIASYIEDLESEKNLFCKEFGFFAPDLLAIAKKEGAFLPEIGWLLGMIAPGLEEADARAITRHMCVLFDFVQREQSLNGFSEDEERRSGKLHGDMLAAYQGMVADVDPLCKSSQALLNLHEQYFVKFQNHVDDSVRHAYKYSVDMLRDHLNSFQTQFRFSNSHVRAELEAYKAVRTHTTGVHHLISVICLAIGVDFEKIQQKRIEFKYMIDSVSRAVGFLNDYYSAPLELQRLYKSIEKDGDHATDEHVVKSRIYSNLVLLYWKSGLSIDDAAAKTIETYNMTVKCFYECKNSIFSEIRMSPELRKAVYACEGFLFGYAPWGMLSGRYNEISELQGSPEFVYQKIVMSASVVSTL